MANPRAAVGHGDVRTIRKTFKHDGTIVFNALLEKNSAQAGLAVTMTGAADDTVTLVDIDQRVDGKLEIVEGDGFCVVTTFGEVQLPAGASATVTVGTAIVGAQGAAAAKGYIKSVGAPTTLEPTLAQLNALNAARGRITNNDVTTAVWVDLRS